MNGSETWTVRTDNVLIISLHKSSHDERSAVLKKKQNDFLSQALTGERMYVQSSSGRVSEPMPGSPTGMRERDLRSSLVAALLATLLIL